MRRSGKSRRLESVREGRYKEPKPQHLAGVTSSKAAELQAFRDANEVPIGHGSAPNNLPCMELSRKSRPKKQRVNSLLAW
jgi:hypothetical protein